MTNTRPYQITAELLSALQTEGYALGVDKHLQIQTLLNKLPDDLTDEALKCALIPLLAQSPAEQEQLYGVFDDCVKRVNEIPIEPEPIAPPVIKPPKRYELWQTLTAFGLLILLSIGGYFLYKKLNPPVLPPPVAGKDNVNPNDSVGTVNLPPQPQPKTEASPFVENKPYPFPNHLDDYDIEVSPTQQWLSENWAWLRWVLALTLTALLVALWRYRAWKRQKLIAQQDPNEKPPYFWNIHIEGADDFLVADNVDYAAQLMRRRADADAFRLDLPRTIQATVERGGMPAFRFKKQTTPSEYLLLIDRQSVRNHRARLFDKLYEAFKAQEVEIARYFYDSDLRTCYDEAHPYGISLADVQQRHYQARLIVVGTGAQLLNPLSNKPAAWTAVFEQWKNRALLTPKPLKSWGYDERQLSTLFTTLPATLQGLGFWVEELELGDDARFETWTEKVHDAPNAPIQPDAADPMPMLQLYFDLPMLEWIAACAIYPTLHWDLTLWLAQQLSPPAPEGGERSGTSLPLGGWGGMTQLNRLSWFVTGEMPNETRAALLNWLEAYKPDLLQKLRLALALELQKNPPPADSVAYEPFRMTVAVNEWLATDDAERKKELETEIAQLLAKGAEPDFTVIKYLKKPRTALDFVVPDAWKKYVHPSGYRALGWLKKWRDLQWLLPVWVIGLVALFYPYKFINGCSKDKMVSLTTEGKTRWFCLDEPLSALAYQEGLLHDAIRERRIGYFTELELSYVSDNPLNTYKIAKDLNDKAVLKLIHERELNFMVDFYRLGKWYYDNGLRDSACLALRKANWDYNSKQTKTDTEILDTYQRLCLAIASTYIVSNSNGKQDYEPYRDTKTGLYGYRHDKTGKNLIPPQYDSAYFFSEGLAAVRYKRKWGFIDTKGQFVIPPQYDDVDKSFQKGIARVFVGQKAFCIGKTGNIVDCKTGILISQQVNPNTPSVTIPNNATVNLPTISSYTSIDGVKKSDLASIEKTIRKEQTEAQNSNLITIREGTIVSLETTKTINFNDVQTGQIVMLNVKNSVVVSGVVVIRMGAYAEGRVKISKQTNELSVSALVVTSVSGQRLIVEGTIITKNKVLKTGTAISCILRESKINVTQELKPKLEITTTFPENVQIGKICNFQFSLKNTGDTLAKNVRVRIEDNVVNRIKILTNETFKLNDIKVGETITIDMSIEVDKDFVMNTLILSVFVLMNDEVIGEKFDLVSKTYR